MSGVPGAAGRRLIKRAFRMMGMELKKYVPPAPAVSVSSAMNRSLPRRPAPFVLVATNHGTLIVNRNDYYRQGSDPGVGVGLQLFDSSCYDYDEVLLALALLSKRKDSRGPGVVAVDCGANIGVHTVEWARHMHGWGSVIAIEAQEVIFYSLCGNIVINNCLNTRAFLAVVGKEKATMQIPVPDYCHPANFGSLELRQLASSQFIGQKIKYSEDACQTVDVIRIDDLEISRLDLLKIDVEGMEMDVLEGGEKTITAHRPAMIVEVIKSDWNMLVSYLSEHRYLYYPFERNILAVHESDPIAECITELPGLLKIEVG
jgi:FkbM family methyltransferase